ncbi:hypothetical protein B0H19DRAFT_1258506 [Mycena capillaripes]|nr:hypothetical protein B0H19DRAFT_1258506 [Mycena capillaripes]
MPALRTRNTHPARFEVSTAAPPPSLTIVSPTPRAFTFPIDYDECRTQPPLSAFTRTLSPASAPSAPSAPIRRKSTSSAAGRPEEGRPKKGDEDYVKRPENAFILFRRKYCEDRARSISSEPSSIASAPSSADSASLPVNAPGQKQRQANLSKTISQQWKALSPEDRAHWENLAKEKKREHENLRNYIYRPQRTTNRNHVNTTGTFYTPSSGFKCTLCPASAPASSSMEDHKIPTEAGEHTRPATPTGSKPTTHRPPKAVPPAARDVFTEALRALKNAPGVAILRSIICPLLDIIDKMQATLHHAGQSSYHGGCTSATGVQGGDGEGSKVEINVQGSGNTINISGGLLHFNMHLLVYRSYKEGPAAPAGPGMSVVEAVQGKDQ